MRIGFITGEYPPKQGGVGNYTRILAQTLAGMRHDIFVLTDEGVPLPGIHLDDSISAWGLGAVRQARHWAQDNNLDVVSIQFQTAAYNMSPLIHFMPRFLRPFPVVTTFHDLRFPYLFPKAGPLRDWIVMHLARSSTGVIVTNHEDLQRVDHLPHRTLIPMGNNILTDSSDLPDNYIIQEWRDKAGAGPDDFLLAHFGFVNHSKDLETLLESITACREAGLPVKLVMIGGRTGTADPTNAAYVEHIDQRIEDLHLTTHITWTGYVEDQDVSAYLNAADVVTLLFRDGASYRRSSLMTAIHHHKPIITSQPQVHIPNFQDGQNLFLVKPGDVEQLTGRITDLYQNINLRQQLSENAATLSQDFDWEQVAHDYLAFFKDDIGVSA